VRVVIGEDEALLRSGLTMLLEAKGLEVVAAVADAGQLVDEVLATEPDLVVTDIRMPPGRSDDGLRAALDLRARRPGLPVMLLSQFVQRSYAVDLLRSGADGVGYQLKQRIADVDRFCADLRSVAGGGTQLDAEVISLMVNRAARSDAGVERLTGRQREVLSLIAEGRSNTAIAGQLQISEKAVVGHTSNIYEALGLPTAIGHHRRVLAVLSYLNH
jgi:DNA-binding NarL/FixJ family response regulator